MQVLIDLAKKMLYEKKVLPFSVYSSIKTQHILNMPIVKPLLILVLEGTKLLGRDNAIVCPAGNFLFLSNIANIDIRNIPDKGYLAIMIEFNYSDFQQFKRNRHKGQQYFQGTIDTALSKTLEQYIEWSMFAPPELWHFRKQELLYLLYLSGYSDICNMAKDPSFSHQLHDIISKDMQKTWTMSNLAAALAVSESTLRRRLSAEGANIKSIIDNIKLGYGLHLVQTTLDPIGHISECCGYQSQSLFTHKFKQLFGVTPTALRKTH